MKKQRKKVRRPPKVEVNEYDPKNPCPGCGSTSAMATHTHGGYYGNMDVGIYIRDNHILRNCTTCRVYWPESLPDDFDSKNFEAVIA